MQQPLGGQCLLTVKASRSLSDTPHSVGILWMSDQPHAETSFNLSQHTIHKTQTSMTPPGLEPAIPASERLLTHALDRAATAIGRSLFIHMLKFTAVLKCHISSLLLSLSLYATVLFSYRVVPATLFCSKLKIKLVKHKTPVLFTVARLCFTFRVN
jgi:hypothetical protein